MTKTIEEQALLPVWHCCGIFGYLLPWAEWMNHRIYPTQDASQPYVYLYSCVGQVFSDEMQASVLRSALSPAENQIATLCLDGYMTPTGLPNWDAVLTQLRRLAAQPETRATLPTAADDKPWASLLGLSPKVVFAAKVLTIQHGLGLRRLRDMLVYCSSGSAHWFDGRACAAELENLDERALNRLTIGELADDLRGPTPELLDALLGSDAS